MADMQCVLLNASHQKAYDVSLSQFGDVCFDHLVTVVSSMFLHCKMSVFLVVSNLWGIILIYVNICSS